MCRDGVCSQDDIESIEKDVEQRMEEAIEYAKNCPEPSVEAFLAEVQQN
jgi:TPP-dependent pyruvate/acetoin dehydrogenase alpha subunit